MGAATSADETDPVGAFLPGEWTRTVDPLLSAIAAQADTADRTWSVDATLTDAIKRSDVMRLSATREIGGCQALILEIGGPSVRTTVARLPGDAAPHQRHRDRTHHQLGRFVLGEPQEPF